jgi:uncharacterized spore protein YtfJ
VAGGVGVGVGAGAGVDGIAVFVFKPDLVVFETMQLYVLINSACRQSHT